MKINRQGCTRIVFVFKRFVIKIPNFIEWQLFLCGLLANMQERRFSGAHKDLARVLCSDRWGLFLIMERAEILTREEAEELEDLLKEKYENDEMKEFMLSDLKFNNWGRINGHLVKVDYGSDW